MKHSIRALLSLVLVIALAMPLTIAQAEPGAVNVEQEDITGEYVEELPIDLDGDILGLLGDADEGDDLPKAEEPVPYYVYHMMLKEDVQEPDILIANPEVMEGLPGEVVSVDQIGLPADIYPEYSDLPFKRAPIEAQPQREIMLDAEAMNCLTIYYTLPLELSVKDREAVYNGEAQFGETEVTVSGQLTDVPFDYSYTPAQGVEPGNYEGAFVLAAPGYYDPITAVAGRLTIKQPAEEAVEEPVEETTEESVEEPAEEQAGEAVEEPEEAPAGEFTEGPGEMTDEETEAGAAALFGSGIEEEEYVEEAEWVDAAQLKTVASGTATINSASRRYGVILKGAEQYFFAETSKNANYLMLYSEDGTLIKRVAASGYSTVSGNVRKWTVAHAFGVAGDRTISIRTGVGTSPNAGSKKVSFTVDGTTVNSVSREKAVIIQGGTQTFTVKTSSGAKYLMMYAENGGMVKSFPYKGNSTVSGSVRTWTVKYTFAGAGSRTMAFRAGMTTEPTASSKKVSFTVDGSVVNSAQQGSSLIIQGGTQTFTVKTSPSAKYLMLYGEDGALIRRVAADGNSTVSNGARVWKISNVFGSAGTRTITFRTGISTTPTSSSKKVSFTVDGSGVGSVGRRYSIILKGGEQIFFVKTSKKANYLMMYTENGTLIKRYSASGNSVIQNAIRLWTVTYKFSGAGTRTIAFRTGMSTTPTKSVNKCSPFTVDGTTVNSAARSKAVIIKGATQTFTVKTTSAAMYLSMYAENGSLIKKFPAKGNSTVSGSVRTWTVSHAFAGAGNRSVTFRAGIGATPTSSSKKVSFIVDGSVVNSVQLASSVIIKGSAQTFTVSTSSAAKYLMLYDSSGKLIKRVAADGNSSISNGARVWKVSNVFGVAGSRKIIVRTGIGTTPTNSSKSVSFTVDGTVVASVTRQYGTIIQGAKQVFTVKTSKSSQYLMMYTENGALIKRFSASGYSTVSNDVRLWTINYSFSGAGNRSISFRTGISTVPTTSSKAATFVVDGTTVYSASGAYSKVIKGYQQSFTVETSSGAKYLKMYAENGSLIRTLEASSSYISGSRRIWKFTQTFSGVGYRTVTFKAGMTTTPTNNSRQVSFRVKARIYRALLIGECGYSDIGSYCKKDVDRMRTMLNSVKGPDGESFRITVDTDGASKYEVLSLIQSTFNGADEDDVSLFFITSHGVSEETTPAYDGALGMGPNNKELLLIGELSSALQKVPGKVIVFLQACGSGAAVANNGVNMKEELERQRREEAAFNRAVVKAFSKADTGVYRALESSTVTRTVEEAQSNTSELIVENKFYVLTCCAYHQLGWAGFFPMWLTEGIGTSGRMPADSNGNGRVTLHELYSYISRVGDNYQILGDDGLYHTQQVQVYPAYSGFELFRR